MKNTLTFDDIVAAEDAEYQGLDIPLGDGTVVTLRSALFLTKSERRALTDAQDHAKEAEDVLDYLQAIFRILIGNDDAADRLFEKLNDSIARYQKIFVTYTEDQKLGEASPSQD